mgnify:CR=1 FL=1
MQRFMFGAAVVALSAGMAQAGGIDRSGQSIGFMYEEGSVAEFTYGQVNPSVSGAGAGPFAGTASGDMSESYNMFSFAFKSQLNEKLSLGVILDQPFGADVNYPDGTGYPFAGATASVDSKSVTAIARYMVSDRVSVHAGLRAVRSNGQVNTLPVTGIGLYTMSTDTQTDYGYLVGATYEIPDIALRAALTYNSAVTHDFTLSESHLPGPTSMSSTLPQSVNLDFQTGIAAGTLLMASVRWADWTAFDITPPGLGGASLVDYDSDTISYSLGVGRKITDKFSASITAGYEKSGGTPVGNLGPTDGYTSLAVAGKYALTDNTSISGGIRHVWIGDATTSTIGSSFTNNSAWAAGLKITHSF